MDASERLTKVFDFLLYKKVVTSQADFAGKVGFGITSMSKALSGNGKYCTTSLLRKVAKRFEGFVNADFLINGTGEMESHKILAPDIKIGDTSIDAPPTEHKTKEDVTGQILDQLEDEKEAMRIQIKQLQETIKSILASNIQLSETNRQLVEMLAQYNISNTKQ